MKLKLLQVLGCVRCQGRLEISIVDSGNDDEILTGLLRCRQCKLSWPVERGIPRFVLSDNYAASFGYQWNRFRSEQIDSVNGIRQSERRLHAETDWGRLPSGKWVLDAGCGAGRFLEVASRDECDVVGVDISDAVDAAAETLRKRPNVHLVQASIYELPFLSNVFDACYCIGVIQHTPDPRRALAALPRGLKVGGSLAVTVYERNRFTLLNGKYLLRPLSRRINPRILRAMIAIAMPVLWPLTEVLFRIPFFHRLFRFAIPVANYVGDPELSLKQRYKWAILDTFDMLSPAYDQPMTHQAVEASLRSGGVINIRRLCNSGVNLVGKKNE